MNQKSDFERFVGNDVKVKLQEGEELILTLVKIVDMPENADAPQDVRRYPFLLMFQGPKSPQHHSGCVEATFPGLEPILLGMYPESEQEEHIVYTSLFN